MKSDYVSFLFNNKRASEETQILTAAEIEKQKKEEELRWRSGIHYTLKGIMEKAKQENSTIKAHQKDVASLENEFKTIKNEQERIYNDIYQREIKMQFEKSS